MRPIGAPEHPIRIGLDERTYRTDEIVIGLAGRVEAIRTRCLDPDVRTAVDIGAKRGHVGAFRALRDIGPSHMVDHHRDRNRVEKRS